jgi:PleD family two-component response regulator
VTEQANDPSQKGRKVLIVDDSDVQLYFEEKMLLRAGFDVRTASSLVAFDDILRDWQPDMVLTDVHMPDIRGDELCKILNSLMVTSKTPVVLFSILPDAQLSLLALKCGADGYLSKHDGLERLAEELQSLWEQILW